MKFEVKNRFLGVINFTAEIDCDESEVYSIKLGMAVKWALKNDADLSGADLSGADLRGANLSYADLSGANLSGADLSYANLSGANLRGANLSGADLSGANLSYANLRGADLRGANLRGANLSGANLSGANLSYANLSGADLSGANLSGADLSYANLSGANLSGADLRGANIRSFKHDFWGILLRFKNEVPELIESIKEGKIDGSVYSGECSCLMGTIATINGDDIEDCKYDIKDSCSPIETWFAMIKKGDTPETNMASKMALEWTEEFLELMR